MKRTKRFIVPYTIAVILIIVISFFTLQKANTTYGFDETLTVYEKVRDHKTVRYTVIGDSIGRGSGAETPGARWFKILERKMQERGIRMSGEYIVQSGATAFEGLYRLSTLEKPGKSDLVFIVFGENDRKYMAANDFGIIYESLFRKAKAFYPNAEIMAITESSLSSGDFADEIEKISTHYQAAHIDMRSVFKNTGIPPEDLTRDLVHPNGRGYQLYADTIYRQLLINTKKEKEIAAIIEPFNGHLIETFRTVSSFQTKEGFIWKNGYMTSERKGSYLESEFEGNILGVKLLRSPNGGEVKVYIDGEFVTAISTWWPFHRERQLYLASSLSEGKHTVRFEVSGNKPRHNTTGSSVIRISSIIEGIAEY
ncbi:SGNH/GDSL hydrolase family protein [Peribacillus glennii]|uniref:SGNH/GDSL hydrolase family protein n=1 Tax=Peribacillus glennii TaxID=2303991 RepID=UPI0013142017|nr:SGNH/GDSL hydrolase family protein [Peribacillus glennii]